MESRFRGEGITFDDVLLVPAYSEVLPREVQTRTRLTRNIELNIPIVSAAMDTVTEHRLAIALAQEGGMGFVHRNMSVADQVAEVTKVKRAASGIITKPVTLGPGHTVGEARTLMKKHNISGVPIVDENRRLIGILTRRDLRFLHDDSTKVGKVMTKDLVTAPAGISLEAAQLILHEKKVEKLPLVDQEGRLTGMITIRDIDQALAFPHAARDAEGRFRVGAAVGVMDLERVEALVQAGVDVIGVDSAHGHSRRVIETLKEIKKRHKVEVAAGNVAAEEGARDLVRAGADAVKVGVGPGSICTTRVIAGIGVPQVTAIFEAVRGVAGSEVPVIADGGIKFSGDITKALAAGAHTVMIGNLLAGTEESPGQIVIFKGRSFKVYRGMGSLGVMAGDSRTEGAVGLADRYGQKESPPDKLVPEGIEGRVPYKGPVAEFVYQLVGGLRSGMGYVGARTIEELRHKTKFFRVTAAGLRESHPHDIQITREAPNYRVEEIL